MSFENEIASDEDIDKFDLKGIWDKYHPFRKGKYYFGNRPSLTIDRSRNVFLLPVGQGNREHGNRKRCLLWWDGAHVIVEIDLVEGSSTYFEEVPFKRVWKLVSVEKPDRFRVSDETLILVLKEALTVYGYDGARKQIPNTLVEFKF